MNAANSSENIDHNRRRFLGSAAMTVASAHLCLFSFANAETTQSETTKKERSMTTAVATHEETTQLADTAAIRPFKVQVPETELTELRRRINNTKWPDRETVTDTSQGVQLATTEALAR
jgi:hypothetical protein